MLKNIQKSKGQKGFTIIEVLIVLAIAGLIMVVVFLAVPALQRSGRNNAMNTNANNVLTAVGTYSSDNGGTLPANMGPTAPVGGASTIGAAGTNQATAKVDTGVSTVQIDTGAAPITNASPTGTIEVVKGVNAVCNATSTGLAVPAGTGSPRSYAVLYIAERGSGKIVKCVGA